MSNRLKKFFSDNDLF